jgi:bacillithiol biosynthesis deacetylase BshB1
MTEGEGASRGFVEERRFEKSLASEQFGISLRLSLNLPDTEIGASREHLEATIDAIRRTEQRVVLAPYLTDRHPDHEAAGRLVRSACFYAGVNRDGKRHRPERLYFYMIHTPFTPSFVVDISVVWEQKRSAISAHRSRFGPGEAQTAISGPEFMQYLESRAVFYGSMVSAIYGEPFFSMGPAPEYEIPGLGTDSFSPGILRYSPF